MEQRILRRKSDCRKSSSEPEGRARNMDEEVGMGSGGEKRTLFISSQVNGISEHGDCFK